MSSIAACSIVVALAVCGCGRSEARPAETPGTPAPRAGVGEATPGGKTLPDIVVAAEHAPAEGELPMTALAVLIADRRVELGTFPGDCDRVEDDPFRATRR